jgi:hypothetical protein
MRDIGLDRCPLQPRESSFGSKITLKVAPPNRREPRNAKPYLTRMFRRTGGNLFAHDRNRLRTESAVARLKRVACRSVVEADLPLESRGNNGDIE